MEFCTRTLKKFLFLSCLSSGLPPVRGGDFIFGFLKFVQVLPAAAPCLLRPVAEDDWRSAINPEALVELSGCKMEPLLKDALPGECFQFERNGYFCVDTKYSLPGRPVFNRTVALRDSWGKKNRVK